MSLVYYFFWDTVYIMFISRKVIVPQKLKQYYTILVTRSSCHAVNCHHSHLVTDLTKKT